METPANRGANPDDETRPTGPPIGESRSALPTRLSGGRYRVIRPLGEGGQKHVYLAHDARLDREVVIAMLKAGDFDEDALARLQREGRALARLGDHPHIVTVHDLVEEGGICYLVAQYIDGGSLKNLRMSSPNGQLPVEAVIRIGSEVCAALDYVHHHGIVHRDVKPGNIWFTRDGVVKLGDFGLAIGLNLARVTGDGTLLGTVAYMAPEQALGMQPEPAADLYSLGVVLYELVTGRLPFAGDSVAAIVSQHLNAPPVPPSFHAPGIPGELERIILKLLAKTPDARWRSARDVQNALSAIRLTTAAPRPPDTPASSLDRLATGVFVGRTQELERLKAAFEDMAAGRGSVVLLSGEPGSGKTSTAEQLLTYARLRGADVARSHGYEGEGAPAYWPWVQILREYLSTRPSGPLPTLPAISAAALAQLDSTIAERLQPAVPCPPLEPAQARFRLFDAVASFLRSASIDRPLVVFLDDLQWADAASHLLLQFLSREMRGSRMLIVGTHRDVQLDRQHPLSQTLGTLSTVPGHQRIALTGLPEADVVRFVEMTLGSAPPAGLVRAVYEETEGNPFFITEVVRLLVTTGQLNRSTAARRWTIPLPQGVRDVVNRRLAHLSDEANDMLALASVVGREFQLETIARLLQQSGRTSVFETIDEALTARVLIEPPGALKVYRFSHALIREALYEGIGVSKRLELHRRIGEVFEELYADDLDGHVAEIAGHLLQAMPLGDHEKAIQFAVRAARRADSLFAFEQAADQYGAALAALDPNTAPARTRRVELLLARGEVQTRAGLLAAARESFNEAATLARQAGLAVPFAHAALGFGSGSAADRASFSGLTDHAEVSLLQEALDVVGMSDLALRTRLLSQLALALYRSPDERVTLSQRAVDLARDIEDPGARVVALFSRCVALLGFDRTEERLELARQIVTIAEQVGDREMALRGRYRCFRELLELGDMRGVDNELTAYTLVADQVRQPRHSWYVPFCRASLALFRGEFDQCERLNADAIAIGRNSQDSNVAIYCGILTHTVMFLRGRFEEIESVLTRFIESHPAVSMNNRAVLARLYCFMGRLDDARREFDILAAKDFTDVPMDGGRVTFLCALATTSAWLRDRRRAEMLYPLIAPFHHRNTVAGNSAVSGGPVSQYLAGLAATLGRWDEADALYTDAAARNLEMGSRPWLALALIGHARMLTARGLPDDATRTKAIVQQALGIGRNLGMAWVTDWALQQLKINA